MGLLKDVEYPLLTFVYNCRRGLNQAAAGMQSAFGSMGQQVQKAAMSAAADAAAKEVTNQLSNALSGGGRRK